MNTATHDIICITDAGPLIAHTNFWRTQTCREGHAFLCWNAGTARLLLPGALEKCLPDMAAAKYVIISQSRPNTSGKITLEILFQDLSGAPFVLVIGTEQAREIPTMLENFALTVWTEEGLQQFHLARFRRAN